MKRENLEKIITLRHELHAHPELSMQEVWTKKHLMDFLRENTKHLEIVDCGQWFYAIYRATDAKWTIGFRADFDALPMDESRPDLPYASTIPGVSHKCGHDGHSATLAGLALEIDQDGSDKNVVFVFQHAEEIGMGAKETVETLSKLNINELYAYHNYKYEGKEAGTIVVRNGIMHFASTGMTITMTGKQSHASEPEKGISPTVPIAKLICALPELEKSKEYKGCVMNTIVHVSVGQKSFSFSPGFGEISMNPRAENEEELDHFVSRITELAEKLCKENNLKLDISFCDVFPETRNAGWCADKLRAAANALGLPIYELPEGRRGAEDLGYILKVIPGCNFGIAGGENMSNIHTKEYDFPDHILETGVDVYKKLVEL